jgi:hypothetical protein
MSDAVTQKGQRHFPLLKARPGTVCPLARGLQIERKWLFRSKKQSFLEDFISAGNPNDVAGYSPPVAIAQPAADRQAD